MMLSPQAARMGSVHTTLRKIGMLASSSSPSSSGARSVVRFRKTSPTKWGTSKGTGCLPMATDKVIDMMQQQHRTFSTKPTTTTETTGVVDVASKRFKSSMARCTDDCAEEDHSHHDLLDRTMGFKQTAAEATAAKVERTHKEAWMINLNRDDDSWLHGPRNDDWFTGVHPRQCPGTDEHGILRSLPLPQLSNVTRQAAKDYFDNSWSLYETLFAGLKGEEGFFRPPPHGLRHPQIFYYGHTACLYINKLRVSGVLKHPVNAYFESIFEVGVDEMSWDDMHKNDMVWPTVKEVHEYRQAVYQTVVDAIQNHDKLNDGDGRPITVDQSHPMWALFMGFEHERIHLETSSVLFRETPYHLVQPPQNWPPLHPSAYNNNNNKKRPASNPQRGVDYPDNRILAVPGPSTVDLGKPAAFPSYGWDNEYGERTKTVPAFWASEHMVTNGELYEFVKEGGYRNQEFWCEEGWNWRVHRNAKWPFFWEPMGPAGSHEYALRTIFEVVGMPWDWPVDVNYYEAKAFCRWKSARDGSPATRPYRLLTEAEHHLIRHREHNLDAAREDFSADKVMVTSGQDFPFGETGANLNLAYSSQNPVDTFAPSHTGHRDVTGNAWEWTEDHFNPLKGFEVHHVYDDFSSPCFDGKHNMIVGGSFMSTGDEASVFARFHFRPHFLQHSGFRLVASDEDAPATHLFADGSNTIGQPITMPVTSSSAAAPPTITSSTSGSASTTSDSNVYETEASLHMYLGLHYPTSGKDEVPPILEHSNIPNYALRFPQRVAKLLTSLQQNPEQRKRALDIGCAVGGSSFELAKTFDAVDAFDFSGSFVDAAKRMQAGEDIRFRIPIEAELYEEVTAIHEDGVTPDIRSKVQFFTGDACKLKEMASDGTLGSNYDGVVMANLLCRLPDPLSCLNGLSSIMNTGGVVVMVTPFSWLTEFTPRGKWLGGFTDPVTKEPIHSKTVLKGIMEANGFEQIHEEEMPLMIREHQRKYQYIVSEATAWRKNN